ncbi:CKLF-like MARVEL transmembrane domain-containing protein 8 isoform X1 [Phoca vitulina]|uniref:CKLF-like MARVEL transmembrane domain-containing protein 8 isoform X1 n=1 Tax=Phoca vitulina TaxID=9720 RepID=UPI001395E087|nr:CKLF-like MARVEL transmembrane domain-containing protein 8 isoform X1 [Phoca vitulina]
MSHTFICTFVELKSSLCGVRECELWRYRRGRRLRCFLREAPNKTCVHQVASLLLGSLRPHPGSTESIPLHIKLEKPWLSSAPSWFAQLVLRTSGDPIKKTKVLGLLVWTLIAGTEYFRVPAFGWVMFVAVFYWVLTVFFLIIYITMTYTRIPQVPWTTVGLCFNGSAFVLYLSAAVVDASSVSPERDSHNFNSWAASSFFAFLVTICYAGNTYFSFVAWRSRTIQ